MAITALATAAVASTGYSIYAGEKARSAQKKAGNQAVADAKLAAQQQDQAFNKANPKAPNVAALMTRNAAQGGQGAGSTFLTGAGGAPVSAGMLGRSTKLGT